MCKSFTPMAEFEIFDVRHMSESEVSQRALLQQFVCPPRIVEIPRSYELWQPDGTASLVHLPESLRHLPTEILYNARGLQLFEDITSLENEYYLTSCEKTILQSEAANIGACIPDNASVIELGCGSMSKTSIILNELRKSKKQGIKFYAIDLEESSLRSSLACLMEHEKADVDSEATHITYAGILGTYTQAMAFFPSMDCSARIFLWLGSSIGNYGREDAVELLKSFAQHALSPADRFFVGVDKRNDATMVARAYNDAQGVSREFILNGLSHVNELLNEMVFCQEDFDYFAGYNQTLGRHEAYYRSRLPQTIMIPACGQPVGCNVASVELLEGELIRIEMSFKYSSEEIEALARAASLMLQDQWTDPTARYFFCLFRTICINDMTAVTPQELPAEQLLGHSRFPTLEDWMAAWTNWDRVSSPDIITDFSEQPISLRHPFIFYAGHIPTFCDVLVSRFLGWTFLEPHCYQRIFERGIDPVVEDPSWCHPTSEVPEAWPLLDDILEYKQHVRVRIRDLYEHMEDILRTVSVRRFGQVLHMALEHEMAHSETLLYMLIQSDHIKPLPASLSYMPCHSVPELCAPQWLRVAPGVVRIGMEGAEAADFQDDSMPAAYGWDNEYPLREVEVDVFEIQHRPVSIGEYIRFMGTCSKTTGLMPASFQVQPNGDLAVRTMHGPLPVDRAFGWPVMLTYHQAEAYLRHLQKVHNDTTLRIPTEQELRQFSNQYAHAMENPNVGFQCWSPTPMSDHLPHVFGSVWEWTSTVFDSHPGFEPSTLYPGYSSDFFDGRHQVVYGGSWCTSHRLVGRYRNFFQRSYPYAFIGVRFCRKARSIHPK
eukprot:GGOE01057307.1.p1 GENE.GGOE01057307.1~~GGOE01057307.1.p1  ORF type:complete len:842 (-),score=156.52 GGOE01057307.1:248-2737(-)